MTTDEFVLWNTEKYFYQVGEERGEAYQNDPKVFDREIHPQVVLLTVETAVMLKPPSTKLLDRLALTHIQKKNPEVNSIQTKQIKDNKVLIYGARAQELEGCRRFFPKQIPIPYTAAINQYLVNKRIFLKHNNVVFLDQKNQICILTFYHSDGSESKVQKIPLDALGARFKQILGDYKKAIPEKFQTERFHCVTNLRELPNEVLSECNQHTPIEDADPAFTSVKQNKNLPLLYTQEDKRVLKEKETRIQNSKLISLSMLLSGISAAVFFVLTILDTTISSKIRKLETSIKSADAVIDEIYQKKMVDLVQKTANPAVLDSLDQVISKEVEHFLLFKASAENQTDHSRVEAVFVRLDDKASLEELKNAFPTAIIEHCFVRDGAETKAGFKLLLSQISTFPKTAN